MEAKLYRIFECMGVCLKERRGVGGDGWRQKDKKKQKKTTSFEAASFFSRRFFERLIDIYMIAVAFAVG